MAQITHYDQGDLWTPKATFTVGGVATDPSTVTFKYRDPSGTITTVGPVAGASGGSGITRVSAGVYTYDVTLNDAGRWYARFEGTGAATAAEDYEAVVDPSVFYESAQLGTQALVSLAEAKDWLNQQQIDTGEDLELARVINDVSSRIIEEAGREFVVDGTNPQVRLFEVETLGYTRPWYIDGDFVGSVGRRTVDVGDLTSYTQIRLLSSTDWTTVLATPSLTQVAGLPLHRKSWEPINQLEFAPTVSSLWVGSRVEVTGNWGFPAIPGTIRQAALDSIAWIIDRDVEHYRTDLGDASAPGGQTVILRTSTQPILSLPPAALAAAWAFKVRTVA
jgi:hypothetical protein